MSEKQASIPAPTLYPINNPDGDENYGVAWTSVSGATWYFLQEAQNATFANSTQRYAGSATSFAITFQPAGTWYYRVMASDAAGNSSPWSNVQSVTVVTLSAPTLYPINNSGGDNYQVAWLSVNGATSYILQEDGDPNFGSPNEYDSGGNSSHLFTFHPGGTWYYRVRAYNATHSSDWSNIQWVTVNQ
jgi:hypothetical protein